MSRRRWALTLVAFLAAGLAPADTPPPRELDDLTGAQRLALLRRAQVWRGVEVESRDLLAGPSGEGAFPFDAEVACDYSNSPLSGGTPKFDCDLGAGDVVKVKYGRGNGEVYAEVAASRLLWALGFGADRMYPVRVTCRRCPIEPWWWRTEARVDVKRYPFAAVERRLPGKTIETGDDEGWAWPELDHVAEDEGGAPRAHRDALKLLMAFLQNGDTKRDNQKFVCLPEGVGEDAAGNETCASPFLYVADLGVGFGKVTVLNTNKNDLAAWEGEPVWRDAARCVGNLRKSLTGTLSHPEIGEAGRAFLAGLLGRLSGGQIRDLFAAARVDRRHEEPSRNRPLADWVRVFEDKRDQVARARCPR
jgi:hypothetical protein